MKSFLFQHRAVILLAILGFAFFTRMYQLNIPENYMFDEVYHAVTAKLIAQDDPRAYEWWNPPPEKDTAVDWLHPPLAKYFQATSMLAFGENSFGWRFSSVIFGVLVILMTYHLAYRLFKNHVIALFSAAVASLDGLLLTQSRIAMNDIHVTFFIMLTLYNYQVYRQTRKTSKLLVTGLAAGLALASKWSGLFALCIVWFFEFFQFLKIFFIENRNKQDSVQNIFKDVFQWLGIRALILLVLPICLYVAGYTHMFLQGKGVAHFKELHNQIWWYQTHLDATHPYESRPIQWFLDMKPVWMYVNYLPNDQRADIYAFGNPILFWIGVATVFASLIYLGLRSFEYIEAAIQPKVYQRWRALFETAINTITTQPLFFLLFSYFAVWLPWQLSPRIMFFYHYTPAVPMLCILISYWTYICSRSNKILYYLVFASVAITFIIWYPHWVAIPVSNAWADSIYFLFPQWK